jgi:hypothetical protein
MRAACENFSAGNLTELGQTNSRNHPKEKQDDLNLAFFGA